MNDEEYIALRSRLDRVIDAHWWPDFTKGDNGLFSHYCRTCEQRYTREAFKSHLRDELIRAIGFEDMAREIEFLKSELAIAGRSSQRNANAHMAAEAELRELRRLTGNPPTVQPCMTCSYLDRLMTYNPDDVLRARIFNEQATHRCHEDADESRAELAAEWTADLRADDA